MKHNKRKNQQGIAILISILIIAVLLSIVLTLSAIFVPKIRLSSEAKNSSSALYSAESAIEWCLYVTRKSPVAAPTMSNSATYTDSNGNPPSAAYCAASPVKIIGNFRGVSRALEVSF